MPELPGWEAGGPMPDDPEVLARAHALISEGGEQIDTIRRKIAEELKAMAAEEHQHRWAILDVGCPPPDRMIQNPRLGQPWETVVLLKCRECGWPETATLDGVWTEEQVRREASDEEISGDPT